MALPNSGTFSYNTVGWTSLYKSKVQLKPVKDSAGRALVAREYTLDVEGAIGAAPGGTTDATLTKMRRLLEQPAGALLYNSKGFGTLNVNVPGGKLWDAAYGPWPEVLAWDPVGNDQGCLVKWRCTTVVPCEESPTPKGIIEYCWEETWDIDEDGYTTRTISGHLTIEATRASVNSRAIPDNADAYRDKVVPDLPKGFRRVTQSFALSEDKRTLKFNFEDQEIPAPLPEGVTRADIRHRARWQMPSHGAMMTSSIGGTLALPARTRKSDVWDKIVLIMRSRWPVGGRIVPNNSFIFQMMGISSGAITFMLSEVEIEDELFGRATSFRASCALLGPCSTPQNLLSANGLWQPIDGTDFVKWSNSIFGKSGSGKAYAPRGMAGISFQNGDDAIVDLCGREGPRSISANAPGVTKKLTSRLQANRKPGTLNPDNSWLRYRLKLRLLENDRIARHKPLQQKSQPKPVDAPLGFITDVPTSPGLKPPQPNELGGYITQPGPEETTGMGPGVTSSTPDILQRVSAPTYTLRLEGEAVRLGYRIPTPRLGSVGGVDVTQLDQDVAQEMVSRLGGLPLYGATFRIDYALPKDPKTELPMPTNPALE